MQETDDSGLESRVWNRGLELRVYGERDRDVRNQPLWFRIEGSGFRVHGEKDTEVRNQPL